MFHGVERLREALVRARPGANPERVLDRLSRYVVVDLEPETDLARVAGVLGSAAERVQPLPAPQLAQPSPQDETEYASQGYLHAAPGGIGAPGAWLHAGGDGAGLKTAIVEMGWDRSHVDLAPLGNRVTLVSGIDWQKDAAQLHGANTLGVVCAADNAAGFLGVVPEVGSIALASCVEQLVGKEERPVYAVGQALLEAVLALDAGDVLLIELELASWIPIEVVDAYFDLIWVASWWLDIVVVEPAGNGGGDLGQVQPNGPYVLAPGSQDFRDSGAIVVGASHEDKRARLAGGLNSNFGERVDCHAWGELVMTCGRGGNSTYSYGGTSAASAIVAGVALSVQGIAAAHLGWRLSPFGLRALLRDPALGTPGDDPAEPIGPMPDLARLAQLLAPGF
jgi:hypothetical protein